MHFITNLKKYIFLLFPIILFSESAYIEGKDPKMDKYYDRNEKACIEQNISKLYACYIAGEKYIYFNKNEIQKGLHYWETSCKSREYGTACYFLAKTYLDKHSGSYYNKDKALKALTKGCQLNEKNAIRLGCEEGIKICCENTHSY